MNPGARRSAYGALPQARTMTATAHPSTDILKALGIQDVNPGGFGGEWIGSGPDLEVTTPADGSRMRIEAISHSAHFDERSQLLRDLAAAMEEATDQDTTLVYPLPADAPLCIVTAHEQLAQLHGI